MIKRFCDCCGDPITDANGYGGSGRRLRAELQSDGVAQLEVEVVNVKNGLVDNGDFCKYCVLDALQRVDDRIEQDTA